MQPIEEMQPITTNAIPRGLEVNAWKDTGTLKNEIWKDIEGYEGLYKISTFGRVYSYGKITKKSVNGKIIKNIGGMLKISANHCGYVQVSLYNHNSVFKRLTVHRLVAKTFIPNPLALPCVNHKDGNPLNNNIDNLEWVTFSENTLHAIKLGLIDLSYLNGQTNGKAKLTEADVIHIRKLYFTTDINTEELAKLFHVTSPQTSNIINYKSWRHLRDYYENHSQNIKRKRSSMYSGEKNYMSKLTDAQILEIRKIYNEGNYGCRKLAKIFGTTKSNILNIIHRRTWSHI